MAFYIQGIRFAVSMFVVALCSQSAFGTSPMRPLPKIAVIATGGTIAGVAAKPTTAEYDPGKLMIDAVLAAVPELGKIASVQGEQLRDPAIADLQKSYINVGSFLVNERHRFLLASRIAELLNDVETDGVIVTHGTDTIEETAFYLSMTVKSSKPVVLVGAVRPSNHAEPDGPGNILDAAQLIADPASRDRGVMVVMGDRVHSAFDVTKVKMVKPTDDLKKHTPFASPHFGTLARFEKDHLIWAEYDSKRSKQEMQAVATLLAKIKEHAVFDPAKLENLPVVIPVYVSAGTPKFIFDAIKAQPVKAVVFIGTGEGSLDPNALSFLKEIQCLDDARQPIVPIAKCVPSEIQVLRASRSQQGYLRENYYFTRSVGTGTLTATKAQILAQMILATWPVGTRVTYESFRAAFVSYLVEGWL